MDASVLGEEAPEPVRDRNDCALPMPPTAAANAGGIAEATPAGVDGTAPLAPDAAAWAASLASDPSLRSGGAAGTADVVAWLPGGCTARWLDAWASPPLTADLGEPTDRSIAAAEELRCIPGAPVPKAPSRITAVAGPLSPAAARASDAPTTLGRAEIKLGATPADVRAMAAVAVAIAVAAASSSVVRDRRRASAVNPATSTVARRMADSPNVLAASRAGVGAAAPALDAVGVAAA